MRYYTIENTDIGRNKIYAFNGCWYLQSLMGYIGWHDVGKRIYLVDGTLQLESNAQYRERTSREFLFQKSQNLAP